MKHPLTWSPKMVLRFLVLLIILLVLEPLIDVFLFSLSLQSTFEFIILVIVPH
jgi:hypothetical protein